MPERGAPPKVPAVRRVALRAVRSLFTPLLPDDYLALINPLWSTREQRGRVERVEMEGADAVTVMIRPGFDWPGHQPGQYVRLGVLIDGAYHWRAYSLTSDPDRGDGLVSVSPKLVESGIVSPYLVHHIRPGAVVRLGEVEGVFTLPDPPPAKFLFVSAGSGITPIMSMLCHLDRRGALDDAVVVHSARTEGQVMFGSTLHDLDQRHDGLRLHLRLTGEQPRLVSADLDWLCPDWRGREAFCSGPGELLDALIEHWEANGDPERMHLERFQPLVGGGAAAGEGGTVHFRRSDVRAECAGADPILVAGEQAGLTLPHGCRIGICHTCVGTVRSGYIRDLRSAEVQNVQGEVIRTCVNTAEGDIEIEL